MRLHELPESNNRSKKRIARGGKRGTTAGRGTKGQKSRSGHVIRPAERDLMLRLPKKRGFRNKTKGPKYLVFNLSDIVPHLAPLTVEGKTVLLDRTLLAAVGLIEKTSRGASVKILGSGEIKSAITVKGLSVSKEARAKIEKAGGKVE